MGDVAVPTGKVAMGATAAMGTADAAAVTMGASACADWLPGWQVRPRARTIAVCPTGWLS